MSLTPRNIEQIKAALPLVGMQWFDLESVRTYDDLDAFKATFKAKHRKYIRENHPDRPEHDAIGVRKVNVARDIVDGLSVMDFRHIEWSHPGSPIVLDNIDYGKTPDEAIRELKAVMEQWRGQRDLNATDRFDRVLRDK